jgi:hypothetical protein
MGNVGNSSKAKYKYLVTNSIAEREREREQEFIADFLECTIPEVINQLP